MYAWGRPTIPRHCFNTVSVVASLQVTAVSSVGLAEGSGHVNWKKVRYTIVWWSVGFGVVMVCTAALVAQGLLALLLVLCAVCSLLCLLCCPCHVLVGIWIQCKSSEVETAEGICHVNGEKLTSLLLCSVL